MSTEQVTVIVAAVVLGLLSLDLALRWRGRNKPATDLVGMGRLLPLPVLAIIGGISAHTGCGWVGWGLLITAGLCSADAVTIAQIRAGSPWERAIILRSLIIFEAAVIALSSVKVVTEVHLFV